MTHLQASCFPGALQTEYVFSGSWITTSTAPQIVRRKRQNINHDVTDFLG